MAGPSQPVNVPMELAPANVALVTSEFAQHRRLSVRQKKRWLDILFNWESLNSYAVFDEDGQHALQVKEDGGGFFNLLKRLFLRTARPFSSTVYDNPIPKPLMRIKKPFRFFFHQIELFAADGTPIGTVVRRWSWIRRIYSVLDANGQEVATLFGPFFRPWTFEIQIGGVEQGILQKRWSGFTKELFSDADNFVLDVERVSDPKLRALCFAATVLIDVVHFERSQSH